MSRDGASFRDEDVQAVHGSHPRCFLTGIWQFAEKHHIFGRGYDRGARPGDPERAMFGSIFNLGVLNRDIHKGAHRDSPEMRRLLLRIAKRKVEEAIRRGDYQLRVIDRDFLAIAEAWLEEHPC